MGEYERVRRVVYNGATFVPVCEQCGRFVRAPERMAFDRNAQPVKGQVTCAKCGKTNMLFEGYY